MGRPAGGDTAMSVAASCPKIAPARRCAYTVLRRVFERGAYADRALQAESKPLDARDRALAMRLTYGAVQRRLTLDHLIAGFTERSPEQLDAPVLAALRLGLYELLYLRGAPDHAVVADAVELAKTQGRAGHGLVNAVLRRATREGAALLDALTDDTPQHASVKHSHPEWIVRMWWQELGPDAARALMACDNEPGEVALRANTLRTDAPRSPPSCAAATRRSPPMATPRSPRRSCWRASSTCTARALWREGAFLAQSRAAMLVARALAPEPGDRVLDLCAAPGGKSTHLAALMQGQGEVLAVERNPARAGDLARTAQRLRAGNSSRGRRRGAPAPGGPRFDRVLVDPPCSGLGTLQARADLRWRVTPETIAEMARTQAAILDAGAQALRPGGVLVYSTCTISPSENELPIATFLDSTPTSPSTISPPGFPGARLLPRRAQGLGLGSC